MNEKKEISQGDKCPYWALENIKECGMSKGGLYIPMTEHVRMFCLSPKHYLCPQYIKGYESFHSLDQDEVNEYQGNRGRRKLRRYPRQLYLDLLVCDKNIGLHKMNAYKAKSLDVSLGGLRIESSKNFQRETDVFFVMDPDYSSDSLLGFGKIKWCEQKEDTKDIRIFESGIAFSSYSTSESIKEYLAL